MQANGTNYLLMAASASVSSQLQAVNYPQAVYGCAYGNKIEQGFEGYVFTVEELEL